MSQRYHVARAMGEQEFARVYEEDSDLLAEFGLQLLSVENGVRAAVIAELRKGKINPWNVVTIEMKSWDLIRPLLLELRSRRSGEHALRAVSSAK